MCCFVVVFVVNSLNLHIFVCARTLRFVVIRVVFIEAERHTSENIQKWTDKALEGVAVGLKASELLEPKEC